MLEIRLGNRLLWYIPYLVLLQSSWSSNLVRHDSRDRLCNLDLLVLPVWTWSSYFHHVTVGIVCVMTGNFFLADSSESTWPCTNIAQLIRMTHSSPSWLNPWPWSPILSDLTHYLLILIWSDSLLTDPYLICLIAYRSLSDLTHSLIDAHSAAYWYLLSSLTDDPWSSLTHTRSLVYKQAIRYLVALSLTWLLSRIQYSV